MKKEIFFGLLWGLTLGLILAAILFTVPHAAEPEQKSGDVEISISGDSVQIDLDKGGIVTSVIIMGDSLNRADSGLAVRDKLIIGGGRILIDGVELTEDDIERLSVNQDQVISTGAEDDQRARRQIRRKRLATVYADDGGDLVKFGDVFIDSGMVIRGDLVSVSGDITVIGEVLGDVVSVFGDIHILEGARVGGDVAAPFGDIFRDGKVFVEGDIIDRQVRQKKNEAKFGLSPRFNRVEGFTIVPNLSYKDEEGRLPSVSLSGAYAFTLKRWEYEFGVRQKVGQDYGPQFGASFYQRAETQDEWRFTSTENSVAGLFFKEDFHDFFWARGFSGSAGFFVGENFQADLVYTAAQMSNLKRTAAKAIFGGNKRFRENWSTVLPDSADLVASEGTLKEAGLTLSFDNRDDREAPRSGVMAELDYRQTADSDFDYNLISGEIRNYIPLASNQTLFFRLLGGYSGDYLPLFRRFYIGGIGSLKGYEYKEFEGTRYVLLNADYIWYFYRSDFGAGLFFDTGKAALSGREFERGGLKSDVGISFLIRDAIRFDLAQRLDDLERSPVFSARLIAFF